MHEQILRGFFEGVLRPGELEKDLAGSMRERKGVTEHRIVDMDTEFQLRPEHLVHLCEAVISGTLSPDHLRTIGFCLLASDTFIWDTSNPGGERISDVACDWSAPEINYPLTVENTRKWLHYLLTGEKRFNT